MDLEVKIQTVKIVGIKIVELVYYAEIIRSGSQL